jgi:hypothetical protein
MNTAGRRLAFQCTAAAIGGSVAAGDAWAQAGHLGGAAGPDVSLARIVAALILCVIVAFFAVLLIRQRGGKIDLRSLFQRVDFGSRLVQVVETRRLSQHADLCLVRYGGGEYLLLLQQGCSRVLSAKAPGRSGEEASAP